MLRYRHGPESDPFYWLYKSPEWLANYDPPRNFPFWLNLELTNHCQLDCFFCSRQTSSRPLGNMDLALLRNLVTEAAGQKLKCGVRLTGWGEPLLHPQIKEAVTIIKQAGLPLKIYTNGLALTPELFDHLAEAGVDDLQFSMQGLTPAQYEFNRCRGKYPQLRANIEMAAQRRPASAKPFLSVLTSVLSTEAATADVQAFTDDMLSLVDKVAVDLTNLNFVQGVDRVKPFLNQQSEGLSRKPCVDIFLALEIKYDGTIQFCGQDANGLAEHSLGRFGDLSLTEAWSGSKMNAQRDRVGRKLGHEALTVCRNCYHNTTKYNLFKENQ